MTGISGAALERLRRSMERVDAMTPEMRALVHEYGLSIVDAFLDLGIKKPNQIRHIINTVHAGSVEIGNREPPDANPKLEEEY